LNVAAANSIIALPSVASPSSPLANVVNNATDANGQPMFAQAVREALNRPASDGQTQPLPAPKAVDAAPQVQQPAPTSSVSAPASPTPSIIMSTRSATASSKPGSKSQAGPARTAETALQLVLGSVVNAIPLSAVQQAAGSPQDAAASSPVDTAGAIGSPEGTEEPSSPDSAVSGEAAAAAATSGRVWAQSGGQFENEIAKQVKAQLASVPASPTRETPEAAESKMETPDPRSATGNHGADLSSSVAVGMEAAEASTGPLAALDTDLAQAGVASAVSVSAPAAMKGITAADAVSATNEKNAAASSTNSPSAAHSPSLSSVVQQVSQLQNPSVARGTAQAAAISWSASAQQSEFAQVAAKNVAISPAVAHALGASIGSDSSEAKGPQPVTSEARTVGAAQNGSAPGNAQPASHDSPSNQGGQSSSDSSVSPDASASSSPPARNTASAFSDALTAIATSKPEVATAADAASATNAAPTAANLAALPNDSSSRPPAQSISTPSSQTPPAPPSLQPPGVSPSRFVNDAQLTTVANQSEMRIAMQTDKLGAVELHARVSGDEVGAAIVVEKRDAHAVLAAELPSLQQALSEKQLRVEQVALSQGSLSSTAGDAGANAQNGQRGNSQPARSSSYWNENHEVTAAAWFVPEATGIFNDQGRLSVQA
jgi:hypothetical protein